MSRNSEQQSDDKGIDRIAVIEQAARDAVREALRRHMLLGESVAVADDSGGGGVKVLGPDEIRKVLKAA